MDIVEEWAHRWPTNRLLNRVFGIAANDHILANKPTVELELFRGRGDRLN